MKKDFNEIKEKKLPFSKFDLIIVGVVLVLLLALILVLCIPSNTPTVCKIYEDGKCVRIIKLSELSNSRVFEHNNVVIVVSKDGVNIAQSDCSDGACVKAEKITKKGESIVCLHSRVTVTLD